jgi:DNA-binding transcriptional regulator YiaG
MKPTEFRRHRQTLNLTQTELGALVEVHWTTVNRWERGVNRIPVAAAKLLAILAKGAPKKKGGR